MRLIINSISQIFYPKTGVFHPKMARNRAKTGVFGVVFRPSPHPIRTAWTTARPLAYNVGDARGKAQGREKPRRDKPDGENAKLK